MEAPIRVASAPASPASPPPETWESPTVLPDEIVSYKEQIAYLNQERDNLATKVAELSFAAQERDHLATKVAELSFAAQERDEANLEAAALREQLAAAETAAREENKNVAAQQNHALTLATSERDAARRDYTELRQQHETLKQELKDLHEQVVRAKDEATTAQRGLALSQKALQETRDALRGASDDKGALENLKKERSTLVQQNMLLQAQNDQVSRELSALRAKISK
jgi:chromosome segregation ATPase